MDTAMITCKTGNILAADVEALVNTVNCVGVMGRGIALQFKKAFPENYKSYATACKRGEVQPGAMFVSETGQITNPRYIINFPSKRHWRSKSRMEDIDAGLVALAEEIRLRNIRSIAIPPLGSGLGGLDWSEVRPRIENTLRKLSNLEAIIFEPSATLTDKRENNSADVAKMTAGRGALVGLMGRYLDALLDPFVTLLEVHKLMYFMQEAGEPLRLKFIKGHYGPYAENLRHVLKAIEGQMIYGYADGGDIPTKELNLVPGALAEADSFLNDKPETRTRFNKVCTLIDGFESSPGLELLATVHWVASKEQGSSIASVVENVHAWGKQKKQFSERQIRLAFERLHHNGWIDNLVDE